MKLTPLDIKKHEFSTSFRGYDKDEVRALLDMAADELMTLQKSAEDLLIRNAQLETKLADYNSLEEKWKSTMMSAQQSAERELDQSRREAELILREAEHKAEDILDSARKDTAKYREEIEMLKAEKNAFIVRLKHLINSQNELLDVLAQD